MEDQIRHKELPDLLRRRHGAAVDFEPRNAEGDRVQVVPDDAKQRHGDYGAYDERGDHKPPDKQVSGVYEAYTQNDDSYTGGI